MSGDEITYGDVKDYENLFLLVPSFLMERFARKNSNLVLKFKSQIRSHLENLNNVQKIKLDLILNSDVDELQAIMKLAYSKTKIKQYKILANPEYKRFIEINLDEIRKMI